MDMNKLKTFFMWSTVLNPGNLNTVIYCLLGIYKIVWLVFNMVPYVALVIIIKKQH